MSRNKLVSDLFEQEFNKEENYKAIMRRIEEEEKKKQKKTIWKPAIAVLGVVVIVAAAFLLFPQGNNKLEEKPQATETPDQQIDDLYINEVGNLEKTLIDIPWSSVVKEQPDITNSAFDMVNINEINTKSFNGEKNIEFGGYEENKLVEYVISYINEEQKSIIFDMTSKSFEPKYLKYTYKKDIIANELVTAKESLVANQTLKILHFSNIYYVNFTKNDLVFDIEFKNCSKEDLEKIINTIFR